MGWLSIARCVDVFSLAKVARDLNLYKYASNELRSDRRWVREVIMQDWRALEFTSDELKNDREIVLSAVRQDGRAMAFASRELRNDKEVVTAVMQVHRYIHGTRRSTQGLVHGRGRLTHLYLSINLSA